MAETISDLLGGVCSMLLAGEIVSVVGAKVKEVFIYSFSIFFFGSKYLILRKLKS